MLPMFKAILQVMFCKAVEELHRFLLSHVLPTPFWEEAEVAGMKVSRLGCVLKHSDVFIS